MAYLLLLIAIILLFGAAAVKSAIIAGAGTAAFIFGVAYFGVTTGWPSWSVISLVLSPLILLLGFTAYSQVSEKRSLSRKIAALKAEQDRIIRSLDH